MQTKLGDGNVMVCGVLPRDAEYKTVGQKNSELVTFGVKVGEKPNPDVNGDAIAVWCNCVCWGAVARAAQNLKKGDTVLCIGNVKVESYTTKDGVEKTSKKLVCEFVMPMSSGVAVAQSAVQTASGVGDLSEYEELLDDDVPF